MAKNNFPIGIISQTQIKILFLMFQLLNKLITIGGEKIMTYWALVVLILAFAGATFNIIKGTPMELILHDIVMFLISLGMLIRIRYMTKKGTREKLEQRLSE
ncbi:MAG: hypothetical protein KAR45_00885 [Desulfobacteraceae bacterium]|nr:hypothetical protein [Desulfobacteraceae bacterium]